MFLLALDSISSTVIKDEQSRNQIISVKRFTSDYSDADQECTRGKNVASTAITTTSTTVVVNTNIHPQVQ